MYSLCTIYEIHNALDGFLKGQKKKKRKKFLLLCTEFSFICDKLLNLCPSV